MSTYSPVDNLTTELLLACQAIDKKCKELRGTRVGTRRHNNENARTIITTEPIYNKPYTKESILCIKFDNFKTNIYSIIAHPTYHQFDELTQNECVVPQRLIDLINSEKDKLDDPELIQLINVDQLAKQLAKQLAACYRCRKYVIYFLLVKQIKLNV